MFQILKKNWVSMTFITNMRTYCKETQNSIVKGEINSFCWKTQTVTLPMKFKLYIWVVIELQWNLYSGETLGTKASVPWIEVSLQWRLGWGLVIINQQILILEPKKASALEGYRICCSHYFKQLDNVWKKHMITFISLMLCVEFPQMQYIDWSELIHVLKVVVIVTGEHLNLSTIFVNSHFWRRIPRFVTQKKCPFTLNRGVPLIEVTNTKIMWTCISLGPNLVSPEWRCPLNRAVSKEMFHC